MLLLHRMKLRNLEVLTEIITELTNDQKPWQEFKDQKNKYISESAFWRSNKYFFTVRDSVN